MPRGNPKTADPDDFPARNLRSKGLGNNLNVNQETKFDLEHQQKSESENSRDNKEEPKSLKYVNETTADIQITEDFGQKLPNKKEEGLDLRAGSRDATDPQHECVNDDEKMSEMVDNEASTADSKDTTVDLQQDQYNQDLEKRRNDVNDNNDITTEHPQSQTQQKQDVKRNRVPRLTYFRMFFVIVALLVVIIGVVIVNLFVKVEHPASSSKISLEPVEPYKLFKPSFDELKSRYPAQSGRFWRTIGTQIKRVLNEAEPTYPATVIIAVPRNQSAFATCFSKDIIRQLNSALNNFDFYLNSTDLVLSYPGTSKKKLDERLQNILNNDKGLVLDHIEALPAQTALLLHGYCDGDNAPYKSAVLILVLHTNMSESELKERSVDDILKKLWGDELGLDEMPALLSRIANSVAILNPEEADVTCER